MDFFVKDEAKKCFNYIYMPMILIDSILEKDRQYYPQVFLK